MIDRFQDPWSLSYIFSLIIVIIYFITKQYVEYFSWCSMVWTRPSLHTTHQMEPDISKMEHLQLKKGAVAPLCEKSFALFSKLMILLELSISACTVWLYHVVQSGVWSIGIVP